MQHAPGWLITTNRILPNTELGRNVYNQLSWVDSSKIQYIPGTWIANDVKMLIKNRKTLIPALILVVQGPCKIKKVSTYKSWMGSRGQGSGVVWGEVSILLEQKVEETFRGELKGIGDLADDRAWIPGVSVEGFKDKKGNIARDSALWRWESRIWGETGM